MIQKHSSDPNTEDNMQLPSFSTVVVTLALAITVEANCSDWYTNCINHGGTVDSCEAKEQMCKLVGF